MSPQRKWRADLEIKMAAFTTCFPAKRSEINSKWLIHPLGKGRKTLWAGKRIDLAIKIV
jgi:hypothetical protein